MDWINNIKALTFDLFGTVMDIKGSTLEATRAYLEKKGSALKSEQFWDIFRVRQRLEQYQDNILMLGHSGYRQAVRRAFMHTSRMLGIEPSEADVKEYLLAWEGLQPFPEVLAGLDRLKEKYALVVLSNGELPFLQHLVKDNLKWKFDDIISVETVGAFKPSPAVYRKAASILGLEAGQCLMVSSNSFDYLGARACSFRAAFVNRNNAPLEISPLLPDLTVSDFSELADALLR
ncbi:MAG: haloacid dehalogenase type II [Spirochaetales bacterium]|nr:haloacid dehalogenase type II [Spirochaetales bacterium]